MSFGRLVGRTLVATGLAATMCAGTYWTAQAMQSGLDDQARTALEARQLTASVRFAGRDAYVWADTPTARADAIAAVKTIPGVRIVVIGEGAPLVATQPNTSASFTSVQPNETAIPIPTTTAESTVTMTQET